MAFADNLLHTVEGYVSTSYREMMIAEAYELSFLTGTHGELCPILQDIKRYVTIRDSYLATE
jgi:hypothetical protein